MKQLIHSLTSTVQPYVGMDKQLHHKLYWTCDYLSMLALHFSTNEMPALVHVGSRVGTEMAKYIAWTNGGFSLQMHICVTRTQCVNLSLPAL